MKQKIRVNVGFDDYNKIMHYQYFNIEDRKYDVGDTYNHEEVKKVEVIKPDIENNFEVLDYDYYKLTTTYYDEYNEEEHDFLTAYIAVRKEDAPD